MNITGKLHQVCIILNQNALEASLKKMAATGMLQIKSTGVGRTHPLHAFRQVFLIRPNQQVIMIAHQNVGKYVHLKSIGHLFQDT
jgi:hypothetical protein